MLGPLQVDLKVLVCPTYPNGTGQRAKGQADVTARKKVSTVGLISCHRQQDRGRQPNGEKDRGERDRKRETDRES